MQSDICILNCDGRHRVREQLFVLKKITYEKMACHLATYSISVRLVIKTEKIYTPSAIGTMKKI